MTMGVAAGLIFFVLVQDATEDGSWLVVPDTMCWVVWEVRGEVGLLLKVLVVILVVAAQGDSGGSSRVPVIGIGVVLLGMDVLRFGVLPEDILEREASADSVRPPLVCSGWFV